MPRGIYDRSKMKKGAQAAAPKAQKVPKLTKTGVPRRRRRTKAEMQEARSSDVVIKQKKTGSKTSSRKATGQVTHSRVVDGMGVRDQFAVIRDNVVALAQVRGAMAGRNGLDVNAVDTELKSELELLGVLRRRHFGDLTTSTHTDSSTDNGSRSSTVPLPPPPQIPPPQIQSA